VWPYIRPALASHGHDFTAGEFATGAPHLNDKGCRRALIFYTKDYFREDVLGDGQDLAKLSLLQPL
jgi:hypothetical protein